MNTNEQRDLRTQEPEALPDLPSIVAWLERTYDLYRDALLSRKYYAARLDESKHRNLSLEIVMAIGTSSAVAGWAFWSVGLGANIWAVITAITAVCGIVKPFFPFPKDIERYSRLYASYGTLYYDIDKIVRDVNTIKHFTPEMAAALRRAEQRFSELAPDDDLKTNERLRMVCTEAVNREIPAAHLWLPESKTQILSHAKLEVKLD